MNFPDNFVVSVTQWDIMEGCSCSYSNCPIAKAVQRLFPTAIVTVGNSTLRLDYEEEYKFYDLPREAKNFITLFDAGFNVPPFRFTATKR